MPESTQTPAAGGVLTQTQVAALLLQPLQAASIFLASGVRIFDTNGGNTLRIPRLTGSTGAAWVAEGAPIPDDDVTFGEMTLLPKQMQSLKVITKVSDELLRQSIVALDSVLQARLVNDVAAALDTELIAGTTTDGTKPRGLLNQVGVQTIAVGGAVTFDVLYDMVGRMLTANVDPTAVRWMMPAGPFQVLRKTKASDGHYLMQPDVAEQGAFRLLGYPVSVTPRIPTTGVGVGTTSVVLWAPSMYAVARDIAPEVKVLTELYASTGQVGIRVQCRYDAAPLYPESVVIATGVTGA